MGSGLPNVRDLTPKERMEPMRQLAVLAALLVAVVLLAGAGTTPKVTYLDAPEVEAAFAKGMPLLETAGYKIHASRREAPGQVEIHEIDTDIIYVLDGKATIVTGGEMVDGKTTAPSEIRGTSIRGGDTRTLAKGDVMVVPNGTPHWFREVEAPFLYYVVKVTK
jgi:cupin